MANGLQRLLVLSLQNTPPADTIKLTAAVWCDTVWGHAQWADEDLARIESAFLSLCRTSDRWPTPKQFLDCLPKREHALKLEEKLTPEEREDGRQKVAQVLSILTRRKTA